MIFRKRIKTLKILIYGDPSLRKKSQPVLDINHDIFLTGQQLVDTMFEADGLGLAAPQVGIHLRMVALAVPRMKDEDRLTLTPGEVHLLPLMPLVLINPEIIASSSDTAEREEGCLSVPDIYSPVTRPNRVFLRSEVLGADPVNVECGGLLGRAIQHEIDHLDGKLFVDHLQPDDFKKIKNKLNYLKKTKRHSPH